MKDEPVELQPERVVPSRLKPLVVVEDTVGALLAFDDADDADEADDADDADDAAELRLAAAVVMAADAVRRPAMNPTMPTRMAASPMTRTIRPVGSRGTGAAGLDHG